MQSWQIWCLIFVSVVTVSGSRDWLCWCSFIHWPLCLVVWFECFWAVLAALLVITPIKVIITQPSIYRVIVYFLLCHESLNYWPVNIFDYWLAQYHDLVSRFAVKNPQALIDMHNNDARMVHLWKVKMQQRWNEPCFGNFKLQKLCCILSETYSVGTCFLS